MVSKPFFKWQTWFNSTAHPPFWRKDVVLFPTRGYIITEWHVLCFSFTGFPVRPPGVLVSSALDNTYSAPSMHTKKNIHYFPIDTVHRKAPVSINMQGDGVACFCSGMAWAECPQTALDNVGMTGASLNSLTSFFDLVYSYSSGCLAGPSNDGGQLVPHGSSS